MRGYGRRRGGKLLLLLLVFSLAILLLVALDRKIAPIVQTVAQTRAHLAVTRIVNQAVADQLSHGVDYQDLVTVEKDKDDKVAFLQPNSIKINQLITGITLEVEKNLEHLSAEGVKVPAGLLSGLTLFSGFGPVFTVQIQPLGIVVVDVSDEFVSVGFNQSKHSIILTTTVKVGVVMPFNKGVLEVKDSFLLAESIIVGPIPETYFDWK